MPGILSSLISLQTLGHACWTVCCFATAVLAVLGACDLLRCAGRSLGRAAAPAEVTRCVRRGR